MPECHSDPLSAMSVTCAGDEDEALAAPRQRFGAPPPRGAFGGAGPSPAAASASERQRQEQQRQQPQPHQQRQQQGPGRGQGRGRGQQPQGRAWVLDGKVYNYRCGFLYECNTTV